MWRDPGFLGALIGALLGGVASISIWWLEARRLRIEARRQFRASAAAKRKFIDVLLVQGLICLGKISEMVLSLPSRDGERAEFSFAEYDGLGAPVLLDILSAEISAEALYSKIQPELSEYFLPDEMAGLAELAVDLARIMATTQSLRTSISGAQDVDQMRPLCYRLEEQSIDAVRKAERLRASLKVNHAQATGEVYRVSKRWR